MEVIELDVEVIVADDHLTADQVVAKAQLAESALLRKTWPRPQRSFAEAKRLVDRDLGILDAHVRAYHASEWFIPL